MSKRLVWLLVGLGIVALAGAGYLGLVAPRRDAASQTAVQIDDARLQLETNRALAARAAAAVRVRASDLFELQRAIPDRLAVQDLLLQLTRLARESGVQVVSVTPGPGVAGTGFQRTPFDLVLDGNYGTVSKFLGGVRRLVAVRAGSVESLGPLLTIGHVGLAARIPGLSRLQANVTVNAYSFDQAAASPAPVATTPPAVAS